MDKYLELITKLSEDELRDLRNYESEMSPVVARCFNRYERQVSLVKKIVSLCEHDASFLRLLKGSLPTKSPSYTQNEQESIIDAIDLWHENRVAEAKERNLPIPTKYDVTLDFIEQTGAGLSPDSIEKFRAKYNKKYKLHAKRTGK